MPNWNQILDEVKATGGAHDVVRRKYLRRLNRVTKRNVIVYYSGWLQKAHFPGMPEALFVLNDEDKDGFMAAIHRLDRSKGLDLLLHTPGGGVAATESLVNYLRAMFGTDIRAIVPQLAMSAGTMVALACKSILMGQHSSIGPIDPQQSGLAAHGIIEEFSRATEEIKTAENDADLAAKIAVWQPIIAHYDPTLIGECEKAIRWAGEMVGEWLRTGMFEGQEDAAERADAVLEALGSHALTLSHARHISIQRAQDMGLEIEVLEDDERLQDAVLSVHHACVQTLMGTQAVKIIENHTGTAFIKQVQVQVAGGPAG